MPSLFRRHCHIDLHFAAKAEGAYIIDETGKKYLDCGDAAISCLGHDDPKIINAIKSQLDAIAFSHSGFFTSEAAEKLAEKLTASAPKGIDWAYLVAGGSEAVESAIKLARQYYLEKGEATRHHIIARRSSYHGNTIGALSVGGNKWRRASYEPILIGASHIASCYEYRERGAKESAQQYCERVAGELEAEIERVGPEQVMAFIAEPVVGASLGAAPAVEGYFSRIREICDKYGVLLILDEVMCGMGRTGHLFACEHDGVRPDIVTIAKGLGSGYQPIGAMLCSDEIYQAIKAGSGFFKHGHSYLAHPTAAAAGLAVLESFEERDLISHVHAMGPKLEERLRARFGQHPHIGDIRGRGFFWGIEFVEDIESKRPFDASAGIAKGLRDAALEAGLVVYPVGAMLDGAVGDLVLLAPPFILDESGLDEMVERLRKAVDNVFATIPEASTASLV